MDKTTGFLDAVRVRHGLTSDYQLSKFLGVPHTRISNYRHGRNAMDEALCLKIAELLELDAGYVLAAIAAEREPDEEIKRAWQRVAKRIGAATVSTLLALAIWIGGPGGPGASAAAPIGHNQIVPTTATELYICNNRRRRRQWLAGAWERALRVLWAWCRGLVLTLALAGCAAPGSPSSAIADFCLVSLDGRCLEIEHRLVLPSSRPAPCP